MAGPKRGALAQHIVPMRSSSDGSVASTVTASDFNSGAVCKWYGVNHGGSAATTSGTLSKAVSLVRSGVFRFTLNATENNYDEMQLRVNKTGLKEAIITWGNADYDDSDLMSRLSDIGSDLRSVAIVGQSFLSDLYSMLSDLQSDFQSRVPKRVATDSQLSDMASDIKSALTVVQSMASDAASAAQQVNSRVLVGQSYLSDIYSNLSDLKSDFQSRVPKAVATNSQLSDLHSDLRSVMIVMSGVLSDTYSALSDFQSDFGSRVPKAVATNSQLTIVQSMASDAASAAQQTNSRVLLNQSRISDIQSFLSDMQSDLISHLDTTGVGLNASTMSDLRSAINALTVTIGASDISDIASAVVAGLPVTSQISDIYSLLSDLNSVLGARIPKEVASKSLLSDVSSDLRSYLVGISGALSDVESQLDLVPTANLSDAASKIYALLSDFQSDFQSRVPKEVASKSLLSDVESNLRSHMNVTSDVVSNIYSLLSAGTEIGASSMSDLRSAITAAGLDAAGADPTGVVGVTDSARKKIDWLTAMSRNKLKQTSTSAVLYNDASTAVASATVSDDGSAFIRGEWH